MGKSRKKHPHIKYSGDSDKKSRTIANRKLRKINKQRLYRKNGKIDRRRKYF